MSLLVTPLITYNSIKIGETDIPLSSRVKVSFNAPYNRIAIRFTPTNCSLSYYEVRVTPESATWDIGVGNLAYWNANIALNQTISFYININSTLFSSGDGVYRIGLYGRSAVDGSWDVTYLFFTINDGYYTLADGSTFAVLTDREAPQNN